MLAYIASLTIIFLIGIVLSRVLLMRRQSVEAMNFGKTDKTDFLIPPFALFYFYLIFAHAFNLPSVSRQVFFHSGHIAWLGVIFLLFGLALMLWSLVSFGRSFRVGIDKEHPDRLVTNGAFAVSRNPIYTAFAFILVGQFLVFPNWLLLLYLLAGFWLFNRQVLREEAYLKERYGDEYTHYSRKVRRYL